MDKRRTNRNRTRVSSTDRRQENRRTESRRQEVRRPDDMRPDRRRQELRQQELKKQELRQQELKRQELKRRELKKQELQRQADRKQTVNRQDIVKGNENVQSRKGQARIRRRKRSHTLGLTLVSIQAIASMVMLGMLHIVGMVPLKYIIVIGLLLLCFEIITLVTQLNKNSKAIGGKILSGVMIVLLIVGNFYIGKINGAVEEITEGNYKIDNMAVVVLKKDKANTLEDLKNYKFGVQDKMGAADVQETVENINEKLGTEIKTVKYENVHEQVKALLDGKVKAVIYNEGYTGNLNDEFLGYINKVKIIDRFKIKKELQNDAVDTNISTEPFSVYISGIDVYGEIEQTSRSDVNIIATINPETHQVLLITTPRDFYVRIPGVSGNMKDKLTHAGIHGVDTSMGTLEELYNTTIPFYVRVNFTSLIEVVDKLGGVDVDSEFEFDTGWEAGHEFHVNQGMNHFDGKEALAFSRERHALEGGDNQRGKNQQAVITGMAKKVISPQILVKASGIIDSVSGNIDTNMSQQQIQGLIKTQLRKGGKWSIYSVAAEGHNGKDVCFSSGSKPLYVTYPDETSVESIQALIDRVKSGEVLEGSEEIK